MRKNKSKQLYIGLAIIMIVFIAAIIGVNLYASAHMGGYMPRQGEISEDEINEMMQFKMDMVEIMDNYGLFSEDPAEMSREDYTRMQGEMYDLMEEYGMNPGMIWSYGGGMMKGYTCPHYYSEPYAPPPQPDSSQESIKIGPDGEILVPLVT